MRDGTGKFPTPDSHVDGKNVQKPWYITRKGIQRRGGEKKQKKERKVKGTQQ